MANDVVNDGGGSISIPCDLGNGEGRGTEFFIYGDKKEFSDRDVRGDPFRLYIEGSAAIPAMEPGLVEGDEAAGKGRRQVADGLGGAGVFFDTMRSAAGRADTLVPGGLRPGDEDLNAAVAVDAFFNFCTIRDHGEGVDDVLA